MNIEERFLTPNQWSRPGAPIDRIRAVVIHWVENKLQPAEGVWRYFDDRKRGETAYGSTHYIVGLKGEIIQGIPEREVSYNCGHETYTAYKNMKFGSGNPNYYTIAMELCHIDWDGTFAEETLRSAAELTADILHRHGLSPLDITTHHNIVGYKDCPRLFVRQPEEFQRFIEMVRARSRDE